MPSTKTLTRDEMIQNQALDEEVYKAEAMLKAAREFRQKHKVKGRKPVMSAYEKRELQCLMKVKEYEMKKRREFKLLPF
jgi:hypothetical protein